MQSTASSRVVELLTLEKLRDEVNGERAEAWEERKGESDGWIIRCFWFISVCGMSFPLKEAKAFN